ncbi:hypothetical protein Kpol_2002p47 [Vanderwaltozyma polyspora DSM 70294]|uniref:Swi6 N-terminal domain-containing protein n=1 Tax=Vanderwaltozyma polyspora (strain ATCC 22028 / DSM 70294 / BCRC 21397 / CBS 2163 / NBRC 10782 / NRRL Y-8283 / UCD 57-17) TaxID=436907 RepID=A7TFG2_VANPO|nr:uncharacterized protein Kpol_2002p47 [Vanderwaltozyma polyspora DSM 70294]EDO18976.1 hypothetical protein Kpol_2002p47 [Vanderwaltozyma polyspora DSM 70294]
MSVVQGTVYYKDKAIVFVKDVDNNKFHLKPLVELLETMQGNGDDEAGRVLNLVTSQGEMMENGETWISGDIAEEVFKRGGIHQEVAKVFTNYNGSNNVEGSVDISGNDVKLRFAKEASLPSSEKEKLKLESFLQRVLTPNGEDDMLGKVEFSKVVGELDCEYPGVKLNFNVKVDEHGNTPLHWVASVANVELVRDLIAHGADVLVGDNQGESPLVKAVKCVNNYEHGTFEKMLVYLYPCMLVMDHHQRSILHHISALSGQSGYSIVSSYYLDVLMGWVVNGDKGKMKNLDLKWLIENMLNRKDDKGDTCVNIAARLGSVQMVDTLMEYGADTMMANNAGLRAYDFSVYQGNLKNSSGGGGVSNNDAISGGRNSVSGFNATNDETCSNQSGNILNEIQNLIGNLSQEHEVETEKNQKKVQDLYQELDMKRQKLAEARESLAKARQVADETSLLQEQLNNIRSEIEVVDGRTGAVSSEILINEVSKGIEKDKIYEHKEVNIEDSKLGIKEMRERIEAYKKDEEELEDTLESIKRKQTDLESKFRRVLSLCLKIDEHKVDAMLDGLLQAISSEDPQDVDTDEMQHFLKKHARI